MALGKQALEVVLMVLDIQALVEVVLLHYPKHLEALGYMQECHQH